jgi:hypothetical protein
MIRKLICKYGHSGYQMMPNGQRICVECRRRRGIKYRARLPERQDATAMEKVCASCRQGKPSKKFHRTQSTPDGRHTKCKECRNLHRRYSFPRYVGGSKKKRCQRTEQVKAQVAARNAVRRGILHKPSSCEGCGLRVEKRKLAGHHFKGYNEPLSVQWLCPPCHGAAHMVDT